MRNNPFITPLSGKSLRLRRAFQGLHREQLEQRQLVHGAFTWRSFQMGEDRYANMAKLCKATKLECNGYEDPPGLANPQAGDFTLLATSPNIDRGVLIPGINDKFQGNGPDVCAFEYGS